MADKAHSTDSGKAPKGPKAIKGRPSFFLRTDRVGGRWWGGVKPTGNRDADYQTGRQLAHEWLVEARTIGGVVSLAWVVQDMPSELSGLEIGFLRGIAEAAAIGHHVKAIFEANLAQKGGAA